MLPKQHMLSIWPSKATLRSTFPELHRILDSEKLHKNSMLKNRYNIIKVDSGTHLHCSHGERSILKTVLKNKRLSALHVRNAIRPCLILAYILCSDILYGNTVKRMKLENELLQDNRLGHLFIECLESSDPDKNNELVLKQACKEIIGA